MNQPCLTHIAWWRTSEEWIEPESEDEADLTPWASVLSSPLSKRASRLRASNLRGLRVFARKDIARREETKRQLHSDLIWVGGATLFVLLYFGWGIYHATRP